LDELSKESIEIDQDWIELLCHSRCQISSLSENNQEYLQRVDALASLSMYLER
jgi:hypothetical protein